MKRRWEPWRTKRVDIRASVLIITLLVSAIIFMVAVSFSTMVTMESKTAQTSIDSNLAFYEADAGLRVAYVRLVNMYSDKLENMVDNEASSPPFKVNGGCFSSGVKCGEYNVGASFVRELTGTEMYEVTKVPGDTFAGSRGKFQLRFRMVSVGRIRNAGTVVAQRTIVAYVDIQRAQSPNEYRGTGNIFYWSEMYR